MDKQYSIFDAIAISEVCESRKFCCLLWTRVSRLVSYSLKLLRVRKNSKQKKTRTANVAEVAGISEFRYQFLQCVHWDFRTVLIHICLNILIG